MFIRSTRRRGISIAIALLVLVVVSVIGLAIAALGTQNLSLANADRNMERARYAAEAGVADAESRLIDNNNWYGNIPTTPLRTDQDCTYSVSVLNNYTGASARTASDGTVVPPGMVYVMSTGSVNNTPLRNLGCLLVIGGGPTFRYAAFGMNAVSLGGTSAIEDSFSSSAGPYSAANSDQSGADIGTNSTERNSISYSGGATNYGDVFVGPGGNANQVIDGRSGTNYTGTAQNLTVPFYIPAPKPNMAPGTTDVILPSNTVRTLAPGAYRNLDTGSQCDVTLQPGTYYFSGNVEWGAQNRIILPPSGQVKIYVAGTWDSQGGAIVNPSGIPNNFQLLGTSSCTSVVVNGGNSAYMVVAAPTASVTIQGNSGIMGAVIGKSVNVQGRAAIHFDRDLLNSPAQRPTVFRRAWKKV